MKEGEKNGENRI